MTTTPLLRQALVAGAPAQVVADFLARIGKWWPVATHSAFAGTVTREEDRLVERADGREAVWGTVLAEAPGRVSFTWHPGQEAEGATRVELSATPAGSVTLLQLVHDGWDLRPDPQAARADYASGWLEVLGRYTALTQPDAGADEEFWFALNHTAGPDCPEAGVFSDPRFGEHLAFLHRCREQGRLVAAGPLPDVAGSGMAVLRVRGFEAAADAVRAAQGDDASVVGGLLDVRVRPWQVALTG